MCCLCLQSANEERFGSASCPALHILDVRRHERLGHERRLDCNGVFRRLEHALPRAGRSVVRIGQERFGPALKHVKMALAR